MEELELRRGLGAEELDVLDHQQLAALAEAPLEGLHALRADRRHELAREALGRGVDGALAPAAARLGDDRAREVRLAEPLLGDEEERVQALLSILRQREGRLARERVAGPDHEAVERVRQRALRGRRPARRATVAGAGSRLARGRLALARAAAPAAPRAPRDRERDDQRAPGLLGEQRRDPREEALANALQVERRRAEQAQAVALGLERQGAQPGLQRERRQIAAETAQNAVPQLVGGGHAVFPK